MLDAVSIAAERSGAVKPVDRRVECSMRLPQLRLHHIGVVQIGKGRSGEGTPGSENRLGKPAHSLALLLGGFRPREGVLNDTD